jgi:hypothetical protein
MDQHDVEIGAGLKFQQKWGRFYFFSARLVLLSSNWHWQQEIEPSPFLQSIELIYLTNSSGVDIFSINQGDKNGNKVP